MRIAISAQENNGLESAVSHHFGRCPFYVLVEVNGQDIQDFEVVSNPYFHGHEPGMVPAFINDQNVKVIISGGMGRRAIGFFEDYGIETATGANGTARQALERYFNGELPKASPCKDHGGEHHHHHG